MRQLARDRLTVRGELILALLPTVTILGVLGLLEMFSRQRLLFGSLASSAFLIYLDPSHGMNTFRALTASHGIAVTSGLATFLLLGHGYPAAAASLVTTILLMVLLDVVHPPAVATSLAFALRDGAEHDVVLFGLALGMIVALVVLQRLGTWLLPRLTAAGEP